MVGLQVAGIECLDTGITRNQNTHFAGVFMFVFQGGSGNAGQDGRGKAFFEAFVEKQVYFHGVIITQAESSLNACVVETKGRLCYIMAWSRGGIA